MLNHNDTEPIDKESLRDFTDDFIKLFNHIIICDNCRGKFLQIAKCVRADTKEFITTWKSGDYIYFRP